MRGRELRARLAAGQRVYGMCIEGFGHPKWPPILAQFGLDFVFMDNEHNPLDRETCAWAAQAYAANGVAPLLRIPEPSPALAAMALDLGAHGVIAPYVETVEQVRALVGAVKYRPLKGEAVARAVAQHVFPSPQVEAYLGQFNPDAVLVIMIESQAGLARLPELLAVGGVDVVFVGPHDLSISCGVPEQFDHPTFEAALKDIIRSARAAGVGVGAQHVSGPIERELRWVRWGCNFVSHKSDTSLVAEGIARGLWGLRETLGDGQLPVLPWPWSAQDLA